MEKKLVLASASPRRQMLLEQVRIPFSIRPANIDESVVTVTDPVEKVRELARLKGKDITLQSENEVILSADTVVAFKGQIYEKPKDLTTAREMITSLSGDIHEVFTG